MMKKLVVMLLFVAIFNAICPKHVDTLVNWDIFKTNPTRYYDKTVYFPAEKEVIISNCNEAYY